MGEITTIGLKGIISKTENIFLVFIAFLKSTQNLSNFEKKDQLHSLNISEVIDSGKCGYFNVPKLLFQNTFRH